MQVVFARPCTHKTNFSYVRSCATVGARSYIAEIGFVGTGPGKYNLHLGGDNEGMRLNKIYKENLDETTILQELDGLFRDFKNERKKNESFGDYSFRKTFN